MVHPDHKMSENNPVYDKNTLEFATVALEFCSFIEEMKSYTQFQFVDKAVKILPLLYLKATLLPQVENSELIEPELFVTEEMYDGVRQYIAGLLGDKDMFLETFHPDMPYSDTPIAVFISEYMADIYQDVANFVALFRQGFEETMLEALAYCSENFRTYWGQRLLNALKAFHNIRYDADASDQATEEDFE